MDAGVFEQFLSTPEMASVFGTPALVQAMLDMESALARAQAAEGLIDASAAQAIAALCGVERIDVPVLIADGRRAGSLAIPLVQQLRTQVAAQDPQAARHVHGGSTSQDVIDTAMVLCTRQALALVDRDLTALIAQLIALADQHRDVPVLARTLMQPASVTAFALKLGQWAAPLVRAQARLHAVGAQALVPQLGGAVGSLSGMGNRGPAVARRTAALLHLREPQGAWHTQRDEWLRLACEAGLLCGSLGKIARDWSLMSQGEIAELAEPSAPGRGGSSAMPHKRNPVACMVALSAAQRAPHHVAALMSGMAQEHERGLGNWQAELAEWPPLWLALHGALSALADAAAGLQVDRARMRQNMAAFEARDPLFDPMLMQPAQARADELLQRLRPQAAALAGAQPWAPWLPTPGDTA